MPKNVDERCKVCKLYKALGCIGRDDGKKCNCFERFNGDLNGGVKA